MGLFDNIAGAVSSALGQKTDDTGEGAKTILGNLLQQGGTGQSGGIVGQLLGGLGGGQEGGMASTLESLAANGLGEQVTSWMSNNANIPVSPQQIHDALGSEQVQQMAAATGLPIGDFLKHLADHLPAAASQAAGTPQS
jgi:uncharacterized protein YidB (DUF937 family)